MSSITGHTSVRENGRDGGGATVTLTVSVASAVLTYDDISAHLVDPLKQAANDVITHARHRLAEIEKARETAVSQALESALAGVPDEHRVAVAQRLGIEEGGHR